MILDIDVGNTRIKWLLSDQSGAVDSGALMHNEIEQLSVPGHPSRVRVASVNAEVAEEIVRLSKSRWGVSPEFAKVVEGVAGISCGYVQPQKLGVDRWMSIVAARQHCRGSYLCVSAGTALTLDVVSAGNRHQGGLIVPGINTMRQSLWDNTWGVKVESGYISVADLGNQTASAVVNGSLLAAVGLVEKVVRGWLPEKIFLTGGDAGLIAENLDCAQNVSLVPDLVLQGLSIALP
jgi:type III pantothenate kinase